MVVAFKKQDGPAHRLGLAIKDELYKKILENQAKIVENKEAAEKKSEYGAAAQPQLNKLKEIMSMALVQQTQKEIS